MMQIIDRRTKAPIKSTINRQRFLRRYRNQIKHKISKAILAITPIALLGLSILFCLIQESDFCWPHVVGILNGTADRAHPITRRTKNTIKVIKAT